MLLSLLLARDCDCLLLTAVVFCWLQVLRRGGKWTWDADGGRWDWAPGPGGKEDGEEEEEEEHGAAGKAAALATWNDVDAALGGA